MLKPVIPFEPISTDCLPVGDNWVAQIKWDGVRMLTYYDGTTTRLINRRLNERTLQYPELCHTANFCSAASVILDGEIIAFDQNKPSFHEIMKRDSLRKVQHINLAIKQTPVTYMLFDVLYVDGEWVIDRTLQQRQQILEQMITPQPNVQITQNFPDAESLFGVVKSHGMEGIVCKNLESAYALKGKDNRWQKRKIFHDLLAVVGGVTFRNHTVNALLLGLYDDNKWIYIGHAGTGKLSHADWQSVTQRIQPLITNDRSFHNEPERSKEAIWVEPEIVVKVQFLEWTPGGTMRHPSIQSFVDYSPTDCTFEQI